MKPESLDNVWLIEDNEMRRRPNRKREVIQSLLWPRRL
jgi:hypothetical protein